jgi:hypothetical protein
MEMEIYGIGDVTNQAGDIFYSRACRFSDYVKWFVVGDEMAADEQRSYPLSPFPNFVKLILYLLVAKDRRKKISVIGGK